MGTKLEKEKIKKEIEEIQFEIKEVLGKCNLSMKQLADQYYGECKIDRTDEERKRFIEKFKKDLSRESSTKAKLDELKEYRRFLYILDEVKEADFILPENHSKFKFSSNFTKKMREASKKIDTALKQKEKLDYIE